MQDNLHEPASSELFLRGHTHPKSMVSSSKVSRGGSIYLNYCGHSTLGSPEEALSTSITAVTQLQGLPRRSYLPQLRRSLNSRVSRGGSIYFNYCGHSTPGSPKEVLSNTITAVTQLQGLPRRPNLPQLRRSLNSRVSQGGPIYHNYGGHSTPGSPKEVLSNTITAVTQLQGLLRRLYLSQLLRSLNKKYGHKHNQYLICACHKCCIASCIYDIIIN